jgi:hypothetical protein
LDGQPHNFINTRDHILNGVELLDVMGSLEAGQGLYIGGQGGQDPAPKRFTGVELTIDKCWQGQALFGGQFDRRSDGKGWFDGGDLPVANANIDGVARVETGLPND